MKIREIFRKYKIKAKKLYTIAAITILEVVMILWLSNWTPTPAIIPPFIQFVLIFENRDGWSKLSEKEKEELTLSEEDLDNFIRAITEKIKKLPVEEIIKEIKK